MKRFLICVLFFIALRYTYAEHAQQRTQDERAVTINITAKQNAKMQILIAPLSEDENLAKTTKALMYDLQVSGQFNPKIQKLEKPNSKKVMKELWAAGYPFVIFLDNNSWRLYDTGMAQIISAKKIELEKGIHNTLIGHKIADQLWPILTGKKSSFSCIMVACKTIDKNRKYIYAFHLSDFLDKDKLPKLIVNSPTLNIAPRWHSTKPLLYFSQHTPTNVRLVAIDRNKKQRIVTNFDGLNMTPSISENGSIVISLTKNGFGRLCKYNFDEKRKKGVFKAITASHIHAISPSFINENEIVFCHIKNGVPRIAKIDLNTKVIEYITDSYSVCPTYSKINNSIAYCKRVDGVSQVFAYNLSDKKHKQLTSNSGDKDECCWSPCGNFIVFTSDNGKSLRTCVLNMLNNEIVPVSPLGENWSFPSWAPDYDMQVF
ncbi:hypothetical protein A3F66_03255 [candidate division TM6 bacterium RIFCSPHIGHO2_12_FULL_32_22]|nr:MAG: hypothetical protein A3F66_03255 [candidate division TM6 bacterium RIFCSPHIGHO2_12_FULL_32_22]